MRTVVDASVAVDVVTRRGVAANADRQLRGTTLLVPAHFDAEVLNAIRRLHLSNAIDGQGTSDAIDDLVSFPATRIPLSMLVRTAALHFDNVATQDALYVACVLVTGADRLLTRDRRLARAPNLGIAVTVL